MLKINDELIKYNLIPNKYTNIRNVTIVDTNKGVFVFKKKKDISIFDYLKSRNFNYYPEIISDESDEFIITRYVSSIDIPIEQKVVDMIDLVSLLHNKTTHFKEVDSDYFKGIYEDINNNIEYLYSYYNDIMTIIESKVYMSPPEYLLASNISKVYEALNFCHIEIEKWYELVKDEKKKRMVVLHNNLSLDHFIKNDSSYLISWDKYKIDMPLFDIYKFFRKNDNIEFYETLKRYESKYPLLDYERKLLFILIALPDKLEFSTNNLDMCIKISDMLNLIEKSKRFISPYYSKNTKNN